MGRRAPARRGRAPDGQPPLSPRRLIRDSKARPGKDPRRLLMRMGGKGIEAAAFKEVRIAGVRLSDRAEERRRVVQLAATL
mgnify:CR=1 FL=1